MLTIAYPLDPCPMHRTLFVFDIETIPDTEAVAPLTGAPATFDDEESLRRRLTDYHLEVTDGKNGFPRQPFHKVVAVSFLEAELETDGAGNERFHLREVRSGGKETAGERELLEGFFAYLNRAEARLVSFNGRGFDLPVLKYRAMKYGVSASFLWRKGDKWSNYRQRYAPDWHCDLLEELSDYGASAKIKLHEAASVLGIPGKFGPDGSQVTEMWDRGEIRAIRDYCETDVINTYLLYIRWRLLTGFLTKEAAQSACADLANYLAEHADERPHLGEFFAAWEEASAGTFFIPGGAPFRVKASANGDEEEEG